MSSLSLPIGFGTCIAPEPGLPVSKGKKIVFAAESLLSCGRHFYQLGGDGTLIIKQKPDSTKMEKALKVFLIATVIVALIALVIKCVYRICGKYDRERVQIDNPIVYVLTDDEKKEIHGLVDAAKERTLDSDEVDTIFSNPAIQKLLFAVDTLEDMHSDVAALAIIRAKQQRDKKLAEFSKEKDEYIRSGATSTSKIIYIRDTVANRTYTYYIETNAKFGHIRAALENEGRGRVGYVPMRAVHDSKSLGIDSSLNAIANESTIFVS